MFQREWKWCRQSAVREYSTCHCRAIVATNCFRNSWAIFFRRWILWDVYRFNLESLHMFTPHFRSFFFGVCSHTGQRLLLLQSCITFQFRFNNKMMNFCSGSIKEFPERIKNEFMKGKCYMCRWHLESSTNEKKIMKKENRIECIFTKYEWQCILLLVSCCTFKPTQYLN